MIWPADEELHALAQEFQNIYADVFCKALYVVSCLFWFCFFNLFSQSVSNSTSKAPMITSKLLRLA